MLSSTFMIFSSEFPFNLCMPKSRVLLLLRFFFVWCVCVLMLAASNCPCDLCTAILDPQRQTVTNPASNPSVIFFLLLIPPFFPPLLSFSTLVPSNLFFLLFCTVIHSSSFPFACVSLHNVDFTLSLACLASTTPPLTYARWLFDPSFL